ncbi:MAG: molybdopterin biosynthesis protein [Myxococcota bacterium]|mgnify:CR=1 FL=1
MSRRDYRYLKMMEPDAAWAALRGRVTVPDPAEDDDEIATADAAGRVSSRPVFARISSPHYHGAAMDGFAVRSEATREASEARPVRLRLGDDADAVALDTGDLLPAGFDAVVMVEHAHEPCEGMIEIVKSVPPWQHVRLTGEDVVQGELVVPRGKRLTAFDLGALLAAGAARVRVARRPRVALIPTGDELWEPPVGDGSATPPTGAVIEFNTRVLAALVVEWGGEPVRLPPVRDDARALEGAVTAALDACDVVVINAGSSAGRDDHAPSVIARLGELLVHGVNVMPGKPTALGVARGKALLGLPGYPVSTVVAAELFLQPLVCALLGVAPVTRPSVRATLGRKVPSKVGHAEVVRVQVGKVAGRYVATPVARGAGVITSLSRASGLLRLPPGVEGLEAGAEVSIELLAPRDTVDATLVHVGSHDLTLDLLHDLLRAHYPGRALSSVNAGSLGGLLALGRGECHFSGAHLLDPESGDYTAPYVRRYLPGRDVTLVHLVRREQGLYVAHRNPHCVRGWRDLARSDLRFVNRQRGAGTRVLLDARLRELGVDSDAVRGYEREEHTHMAVAVAVASGVADIGLGIRAAAQALGLHFVPLEWEPYELCVPTGGLADIEPLLAIIRSAEFRLAAEALGGYDASRSGETRSV